MRSRQSVTIARVVAIALGALGASAVVVRFFEVPYAIAEVVSVFPAYPFAAFTKAFSPRSQEGLFWLSGHSPPFLSVPGVALVYFIPGWIVWKLAGRHDGARQ
jgi:hypothetical protein